MYFVLPAEECQSRCTRLKERYSREKKQQQETTTGSKASRRKTFEFFENIHFLETICEKKKVRLTYYYQDITMANKSFCEKNKYI